MKPLAILALLAFAGCSAHWNSYPMPNITQAPIAPATRPCHVDKDALDYTRFKTNHTHVRIHAPTGYWAIDAEVTNDMSNGMYVRGGMNGNRRKYVPGHNETYGGDHYVKFGHRAEFIVMRAIATPTSGYVDIDVRFCQAK